MISKKKSKVVIKAVALALVGAMLLTDAGVFLAAESGPIVGEYPAVEEGDIVETTIEDNGNEVWYSFVPEEDGMYRFYSIGDYDTVARVYDEDGKQLYYSDNKEDTNFNITNELKAGLTYYLAVNIWNGKKGIVNWTIEKLEPIDAVMKETATTDISGFKDIYSFIPEETGTYHFYSKDAPNSYIYIYDAKYNCVYSAYLEDADFDLKATLKEGAIYYISVGNKDASVASISWFLDNELKTKDYIYKIVNNQVHIVKYIGTADIVTVPSKLDTRVVVTIGMDAFSGNDVIKKVTLPNTVTSIEATAFRLCTALETVNLSNKLQEIGENAFWGCNALTEIELPDSLTTIKQGAFRNTGLKSISIPNSVVNMESYAFYESALEQVVLADNVTSLAYRVFAGCMNLAELNLPDSLESIGGESFHSTQWYNNQPDGDVYAGKVYYAYKGTMPEDTSINIKDDTIGIAGFALAGQHKLVTVTLPDGLTNIGELALMDCPSLKRIVIPNSVTSIENYALGYMWNPNADNAQYIETENCKGYATKIEGFTIVGETGSAAYHYAQKNGFKFISSGIEIEEDITTGDSVETVIPEPNVEVWYSFTPDETGVYYYYSTGAGDPYGYIYDSEFNVLYENDDYNGSNFGIYAQMQAGETYYLVISAYEASTISWAIEKALVSDGFLYVITDDTVCIEGYVGSAERIEIPTEIEGLPVVTIGTKAFAGCDFIRKITITSNVTRIEYAAFRYCGNLANLEFPESLASIGQEALHHTKWYNDQLDGNVYAGKVYYTYKGTMPANTTIDVKEGTLGLADGALAMQSNLKAITLPKGLLYIGKDAILGCPEITVITIPSTVTEIIDYSIGYVLNVNKEYTAIEGFTIRGVAGSAAEAYALKHGFTFVAIVEKAGWVQEGTKWYYYQDGIAKTGWFKDEGFWYYLGTDGAMTTQWFKYEEEWYFFGEDGKMRTGWAKDGTTWYYMNEKGVMQTGWHQENAGWYFLGTDGKMRVGWAKDGTTWYYFNDKGIMQTGWLQDGGAWYFLGTDGKMRVGWTQDNGSWYYMNTDGKMHTNWKQINGIWYYFNVDGDMHIGWKQINGTWYYFDPDGAMVTGKYKINGTWYTFTEDGAWIEE